jgi:hypothetical protein
VEFGVIIKKGYVKAEDYSSRALDSPVYLLSVGEWLFIKLCNYSFHMDSS